jgi:5-bromo-4-chloroindolyl phosphate hydrolysis protein
VARRSRECDSQAGESLVNPWKAFTMLGILAFAAAMAPFVFFTVVILAMMGVFSSNTFFPVIMAFIGWMILRKTYAKQREEKKQEELERQVIEARIIKTDGPLPYPTESYTPPVHFDLLLAAKQDVGRILGATAAITDNTVAAHFRSVAARADTILALVAKEPAKLSLARRFFSSYLPRAADLADGYHRMAEAGTNTERRAKLIDVISRLETAMKESADNLSTSDLARIDADLRLLNEDLRGVAPSAPQDIAPRKPFEDRGQPMHVPAPDFRKAPEPIFNRVSAIVEDAKRKKKRDRDDDDD